MKENTQLQCQMYILACNHLPSILIDGNERARKLLRVIMY